MGMIWKTAATVAVVFAGVVSSQAPEFTQQYRQRIGGALDELGAIVADFETQAREHGLDRQQALATYAKSTEGFLQDRGLAMRHTFERFEALSRLQGNLNAASPLAQPVFLIQNTDPVLFANTWHDFVPAVPVSLPGMTWAGVGAGAAAVVAGFLRLIFRRGRRSSAPVIPHEIADAGAGPARRPPAGPLDRTG